MKKLTEWFNDRKEKKALCLAQERERNIRSMQYFQKRQRDKELKEVRILCVKRFYLNSRCDDIRSAYEFIKLASDMRMRYDLLNLVIGHQARYDFQTAFQRVSELEEFISTGNGECFSIDSKTAE